VKKTIAALALVAMSFGLVQQACLADSDWFDRHDRNHDQRWNYNEYKGAHSYYYKNHRDEPRWNNHEMRDHWNGLNHDGYVTREQVHELHHWD
jgi:hypothetical protein